MNMPLDLTDGESTLVQVLACCLRQQAIIWANINPVLCRHMASLDHNDLIPLLISCHFVLHCSLVITWSIITKLLTLDTPKICLQSIPVSFVSSRFNLYGCYLPLPHSVLTIWLTEWTHWGCGEITDFFADDILKWSLFHKNFLFDSNFTKICSRCSNSENGFAE